MAIDEPGPPPLVAPPGDEAVAADLAAGFGGTVPATELVLWAAMTAERKERALARLTAVRAWESDATAGSAEAIAEGLGISRSRFYRMVSDWRSRPSLASLGAKAPTLRPRLPKARLKDAHAELQKALPVIVRDSSDEPVSEIVRRLRHEVEGRVAAMPGDTSLRVMVDRELRRLKVQREAGNEVVFDLCAIGLRRPGGMPYVLFACVDVATRIVLGAALGSMEDSRAGHRAAAADALTRLGGLASELPWAPSLARSQITFGTDVDAWRGLFASAGPAVGADVQPKGAGVRFGTDLRRLLGETLGRVRLVPFKADAPPRLTISVAEAELDLAEGRARVEAGLAEHNAAMVATAGGGTGTPPPGLVALLRLVAD